MDGCGFLFDRLVAVVNVYFMKFKNKDIEMLPHIMITVYKC